MKTPLKDIALVAPFLQRQATIRSGMAISPTPFRELWFLCSPLNSLSSGPKKVRKLQLLQGLLSAALLFGRKACGGKAR